MGLVVALLAPLALAADGHEPVPSLTVTGSGEVQARPDQVAVTLGAVAQEKDASEAQAKVSDIVGRIIGGIRDLGVADEQIATVQLSLTPVYSQPPERRSRDWRPEITGYRASNSVRVTLDDLSLVGKVIDAGIEAGANNVESLRFQLKDDTAARAQALERAVAQARAKAGAIAKAMDIRLEGVLDVQESSGYSPVEYRMQARAAGAGAATPVQPGELTVQATVTVRYRLGGQQAVEPGEPRAEGSL
jgi:uncharacterized protein YggE